MSGSVLFDASGVADCLAPLRLTVEGGGCDGSALTVRSEICLVGSADDCNLRLAASAPRYVCELIRGAEGSSVRSRAREVRLNGEPFDESPLHPGDRIAVGDVAIVVQDDRPGNGNARLAGRERLPKTARLRGARVDGALLLGELRRLQQELRDATQGGRAAPLSRSEETEPPQENELAASLRALLDSEREETERLSERLAASHREREELERRVAELDDALRSAGDGLAAAAEAREEAEQARNDAEQARNDAAREELDSLRGMLGDAQDELEQMRRVYEARLERAREIADEERLAAVTRAVQEAEERFAAEHDRLAELEDERVAAMQERAREFETLHERLAEAESHKEKLAEVEGQLAALTGRLSETERLAEERLAAVEEAKKETERRVAEELQSRLAEERRNLEAELSAERERLERELGEFARRQSLWDAERQEYERLAAEQTALIAEKQRELRDAQERLAAAEQAPVATPDASYVEDDRRAWEEEKAAFEELARHRMEELAEKTRQVEERLRAAAEKQREEIQREREALAREREEASPDVSRSPGLADYFETSDEELPEPSFEPAPYGNPSQDESRPQENESAEARYENECEDESPRRGGFRFFGDLNEEAPVNATIVMPKYDSAVLLDDSPSGDDPHAVDPEEAERLRQIAEDRLARFAPRHERAEDVVEESTSFAADAAVDGPEESEAPASGFLLRNFLNSDESETGSRPADALYEESAEEASPCREPEPPASVADILARMGREVEVEDDDLAASVEEHSFETPAFQSSPREPDYPVAPSAAPGEHEDDSIEDYMQSLLRRVRGESAVQLTEPVQDVRRTTMLRNSIPLPEKPVQDDEPVVPLTESEFRPKSEAPEQSDKLSAMRELANASTRSAIFSSAVRRTYAKAATAAALSIFAMVLGGGAMWFGTQGNLLVVAAGLLSWVFGGFWGFRAWKTWKELRRLSAPLKAK